MGYKSWFVTHGKKHQAIMKKLSHLTDEEVLTYFEFENMCKSEPHFCPLYAKHQKCHEMESLNCYLCACPNFRFDDEGFKEIEGKPLKSYCNIDSKEGSQHIGKDAIHQNCTGCSVPHHKAFIRQHFQRDWFAMMHEVTPDTDPTA